MLTTLANITQGKSRSPIIFLFGEEEFLLEEAFNKIVSHFVPNPADYYDFDALDGDDISEIILSSKCTSYPMASERRIVAVKRFDKIFTSRSKKPDKGSPFAAYLDNPSPSTILVLSAGIDTFSGIASSLSGKNPDKAEKMISGAKFPYSLLLAKYDWIEFPRIYDNQLPAWANARINSLGKSFDAAAIELLLAQTPPSVRDINNEIEKIALYYESKKNISQEDIVKITGSNRSFNVFELQNAIGEKNLNKSLNILYNMLAADRQEMLIITMLTRYFLAVWKLQEEMQTTDNPAALAGKIGVAPFFVKDYQATARRYKPAQVNKALISLCEADLLLKSSGSDNLLVMQNLITNIIQN